MSALEHILVPTDFSESSACAFKHALFLAKMHKSRVTVLNVVTLFEEGGTDKKKASATLKLLYRRLKSKAMKNLKEFVAEHKTERIKVNIVVESGFSIAEEIFRFIIDNNIDFVVAGTHGRRPLAKMLMGSVAEKLVKAAPCPVMVVKADSFSKSFSGYHRILVGVDFSDYSLRALQLAHEISVPEMTIHVMHVIEDVWPANYKVMKGQTMTKFIPDLQSSAAAELKKVISKIKGKKCKFVSVLEIGRIIDKLAVYAKNEEINLIILGIKGMMTDESIPMGSVPERIIRKSTCPVIIVE
ncbi:universal stress protein [candidate division KSB1 bacterium]|nr:universal stress protein [candidate division KSB1 bacterium]